MEIDLIRNKIGSLAHAISKIKDVFVDSSVNRGTLGFEVSKGLDHTIDVIAEIVNFGGGLELTEVELQL